MTPEDMFQLIEAVEAAIAKRPEDDRVMWLRYSAGAEVSHNTTTTHTHVRWQTQRFSAVIWYTNNGNWQFMSKYRSNVSDSVDICVREMLRELRKRWLHRVQGHRP